MRKIVLKAFGGPEVLALEDVPEPTAPAGGWVVDVRAIGLNFAEVVERRGKYRKDQELPYEIGKECAGVVVAAGPDAPTREQGGFDVGERAIVIRTRGGCYAERVTAVPGRILRPPAHLDDREAAAFAIAFCTSWYAQEELARVRPGEAVLVQAAAGATGSAAVTLALARGCGPVVGVAGGSTKRDFVLALGAHACADHRADDFRDVVRSATDGRGVAYCLESVGGDVFSRSLECLAPKGRLVLIGFSSIADDYGDAVRRVHPLSLFHRSLGLFGLNIENLDFPSDGAMWSALTEFASEHRLRPALGPVFPLAEAAAAHTAIESRSTHGKVLLVP
ncbi:MAG: zinc-binding dehydrogenase [Planctomycetota bacterium]